MIITHTGDASNPGLMSNNAKWFPVSSSRRFRFKVRAKLISGSGGILCRIFNSKTAGTYTQTQAVVTRKDGFETLTVDIPALPATTTDARIAFYVYPSATVVAVDSIAVYDVTDETVGSANASAISDLTTRVTSAEAGMTSQGAAITKLQNDLSTTNANVNKKADATALNALSNRVTQTEKDINSQADSITSLNSTLNINARKGSNPWLDGTFETYDVNQNLGGSARVISGVSYSGGKCMRVTRAPNTTGNSDDLIGSRLAIRDAAVFRVEFWAMMPSGETPQAAGSPWSASTCKMMRAQTHGWELLMSAKQRWPVVTNGLNFPGMQKPPRKVQPVPLFGSLRAGRTAATRRVIICLSTTWLLQM